MKTSKVERVKPVPENLSYGILGLYPSEIKEFQGIEIKENKREIIVTLGYGKNGHKKERLIRIDQQFNVQAMVQYLEYLKQYATSYITDIVKQDFEGLNPTELRHIFADQQFLKFKNLEKASKFAMGHNATKNMSYYIDFMEIANRLGIEKAEQQINKTEHKLIYSLIKVAVKAETDPINEKLDRLLEIFQDA